MLITTTNTIEGYNIDDYLGIISSNIVIGTNLFSDFTASFTDFFGGFSDSYQEKLQLLYNEVIKALILKAENLGANCIIGLKIDFEEISGKGKSMFMVSAVGTSVLISDNLIKQKHSGKSTNRIDNAALKNEIKKQFITNEISKENLPSNDQWQFLITNEVYEPLDDLLNMYIKTPLLTVSSTPEEEALINNMPLYIKSITNESTIDLIYKYLDKVDNDRIIKLIIKNDLFDASKIMNLIETGKAYIACYLLDSFKTSYNITDIEEAILIINKLNNLKPLGKIEIVKGGLLSKEKEKFICEKGHTNDRDITFCNICGFNIYGLNEQNTQQIERFKRRTSALSNLFI